MDIQRLNARIESLRLKHSHFFQLLIGILALLVVFVLGLTLFMVHEGWSFKESFYMVVITLSTVGFQEVRPLTENGRVMTAFLILSGVGSFFFIVGTFSQILVEGRLQIFLGRLRVKKRISQLDRHFIVCGYGRIGSIVTEEIRKEGLPVVVIEQNKELIHRMEEEGVLCVDGDATNDELLLSVGLKRARSIITTLTDEASNVYVTLTARQLNPKLNIIARANNASHITRLELAGANRVVMPHFIGGIRMAQSVLRPTVTNFLELAMRGNIDLQMEELEVSPESELVGKDLVESKIRQRFNLIIIAIKRPSGDMVFNPGPREVIGAGDTLLTVGSKTDLQMIKEIL
ncbi:MAG: NAD-binding protein [Desulfovibrionaceae bacterium]|nr:NAD-binding protein [Desulfovibrionaceae bacterium]